VDVGDVVIKAVVFDVGEVLVDETRENCAWADWLGVPRHTFSTVYGALIAEGRALTEIFLSHPGFDISRERELRAQSGIPEALDDNDLYPDVRPALSGLRQAGLWVGIASPSYPRSFSSA
jgi:beta-phosphoglucomutase-like phosphatase (HAD superfamily)